jgi:hypothetical protein
MTQEELEALILATYPDSDPRRVALLRLSNSCYYTSCAIEWLADAVVHFIQDPDKALVTEALAEEADWLAAKLEVIQYELKKSLPVLKGVIHRAEGTVSGLRGDDQTQAREDSAGAPGVSGWDDVPF